MKDLCFIDVETTGTVFGFHEIIDVGIVRTDNSGEETLDEFESIVLPQHPKRITEVAQRINGFNQTDWKDAPKSDKEFWNKIINVWESCIPICHNPSFERAFISLACSDIEINDLKLDYHWIGTESLGWFLFQNKMIKKLSLSTLAKHFNQQQESNPHTAIHGAQLCRDVYLKLQDLSSFEK